MKFEQFWARGYRSLRDVHLENLGAFNVFYGPNGAGKSNVLLGMEALLRIAGGMFRRDSPCGGFGISASEKDPWLRHHDFDAYTPGGELALGATLVDDDRRLLVEITATVGANRRIEGRVSRLEVDAEDVCALFGEGAADKRERQKRVLGLLRGWVSPGGAHAAAAGPRRADAP